MLRLGAVKNGVVDLATDNNYRIFQAKAPVDTASGVCMFFSKRCSRKHADERHWLEQRAGGPATHVSRDAGTRVEYMRLHICLRLPSS